MTLVSESVLKQRVGVSGTENSLPTLCFNCTLLKKYGGYQVLTGVPKCRYTCLCVLRQKHAHAHIHTLVIVTREVERRSWIGYQIRPLLSLVWLPPVTLDHHIFNSDV